MRFSLDGAEVGRDGAQELRRDRDAKRYDTLSFGVRNQPQACQRECVPLLKKASERVFARRSQFAKKRRIICKTDAESGKFMVMDGMRLRGEDFLRIGLRDARRQSFVRDRDVLRDVRDHFDAVLNVLVQEVGAKLRIQNAPGDKDKRDDQQDGDDGNE